MNDVVITKSSLSPAKRQFLELMQKINFGRIENLPIHQGEPVFNSPAQVIYDFKPGGDNGPRKEINAEDFVLKSQVVETFDYLEKLGNGIVMKLEINNGLPVRMSIKEEISVSPSN